MKISTYLISVFISSILWLFIGENAITDLFISAEIKQLVVIVIILFILLLLLIKIKTWFQPSYYLYSLASLVAFVSIALRFYYVDDETITSLVKTLFKFLSVMLLLVIIERIFFEVDVKKTNLILPRFLQVILLVILGSFIFYIINPLVFYTFNDHAGHELKVVYGSLSSSIYRIGSANFSRLNFIFDEPGTFGMFISFVVSFMFYIQKRITFSLILVICTGVASVSLSYFLFLFCFFVYLLCKRFIFRLNGQTLVLIIFTFSSLGVLLYFRDEVKLVDYIFDRFETVTSNKHNRSEGNSEALKTIIVDLEGVSVSDFEKRRFSSSGVFVIAAYHGILYALSFTLLYAGFMLSLIKRGGDWFPLIIALSLTFLSRNNLFNYSGPGIMLFAVYICYLSFENNNAVKINRRKEG